MKRLQKVFVIVVAMVGLLVACPAVFPPPLGPDPPAGEPGSPDVIADPNQPISPISSTTGALIKVPTISSRLLSVLNATYQPSSTSAGGLSPSAILFATDVDVRLFQATGDPENPEAQVNSWSLSAATSLGQPPAEGGGDQQSSGPSTLEQFLAIDAGIGYRIEVDVYNNLVSTEVAMVAGESTVFNVSPGRSTVVGITAVPVEPLSPTINSEGIGTFDVLSMAQTPYSFPADMENGGGPVISGIGGEAWFALNTAGAVDGDYIRIIADPNCEGAADAVLLVYNSAGQYLLQSMPAMSWGFLPDSMGGQGGTRSALMGPAYHDGTAFDGYIGMVLLNRNSSVDVESVGVRFDLLQRPYPPDGYANAVPWGEEIAFESFVGLAAGATSAPQILTQIPQRLMHWFKFDGIDWLLTPQGEDPIPIGNPLEITVTATFDVLDQEHLVGGSREWVQQDGWSVEQFIPALALVVGDMASENPPTFYTPMEAREYNVTQNANGSTTISFTTDVDTTGASQTWLAGAVVSSRWSGNQFTISWSSPGEVIIVVD